MSEYIPVIIALIAGPTVAFVTARMSRPKVRADATRTLTDISLSLVEPQMRRIEHLEAELSELRAQVAKLEAENHAIHSWAQLLFSQVVEAGQDPIPFNSEWLPGDPT